MLRLRFAAPVAVAALALTTLLASAPVQAETPALTVAGTETSWVDVTLSSPLTVGPVTTFADGPESTDLGSSADGEYVGVAVYTLPDLAPVMGYVEFEHLAGDSGATVTSEVFIDQGDTIPAGSVRIVLLSSGAGSVRLPLAAGTGLSLTAEHRHPSAGGSATMVDSGGALWADSGPLATVTARRTALVQAARVNAPDGRNSVRTCENRVDEADCDLTTAGEGTPLALESGNVGVTLRDQFTARRAGQWERRYRVGFGASLRAVELAVDPGPPVVRTAPDPTVGDDPPPLTGVARDIAQACPSDSVPSSEFTDSDGVFTRSLDCAAWYGLILGYDDGTVRPSETMSRGQMAAVLARLLRQTAHLTLPGGSDRFVDDDTSPFQADIEVIADLGVAQGITDTRFGPARAVTRGEMAAFLNRTVTIATDIDLSTTSNWFRDDQGSTHEGHINALANNGILRGDGYGQVNASDVLTRGEAASLLVRTLDLLVESGYVDPAG